MGPGPDEVEEIRREIDESRERLGEAVGGLAYKADVKNRGKEALAEKKEAVADKVDEVKSKLQDGAREAAGKAADKTPSGEHVKGRAQGAADTAKGHPAAVAGGAAVAGLAAGLALPETQIEREKLKPHAQDARAEVTGRAQQTVQQVRDAVQDAAGSVTDAVKQQAEQQDGKVGEIAEKAADKAQQRVGSS